MAIFARNRTMILSMTGFGEAKFRHENKEIRIEIKAINSKMGDIRFKMPIRYNAMEVKFRRKIQETAFRGKFDVTVSTQSDASDDDYQLNIPLFKSYYQSLTDALSDLDAQESNLAAGILKIYNVVKPNTNAIDADEENALNEGLKQSLESLSMFRKEEGKALLADFDLRCNAIQSKIELLEPLETARTENLRERLKKNLNSISKEIEIDKNRFEQELVYYLEKFDLTEEKVRLNQHCEYFLKTLHNSESVKGKSLAFISQEMGREINTIGSKANDHQIQHIVVGMKEELEKIKEQLSNVV